jgi:hypothetical protein
MTVNLKKTANPRRQPCYRFHRLALAPLLSENLLEAITVVKNTIQQVEEQPFLIFLLHNGLGPFWFELLKKNKITSLFSPEFTRELRNITSYSESQYLFQKAALEKIDNLFTKHSIPYAIFKGAHTRELLYTNPPVRSACDIDILISRSDQITAIKALVDTGFVFHPAAVNISHEASLSDKRITIDLHWEILRPGRTKRDVTDDLLATRQHFSDHCGLNNEANLFIMLVHPVFTKYATSPNASLMRVVDLVNWIEQRELDWNTVLFWLDQAGLRTAAWLMLEWMHSVTDIDLPQPITSQLQPGRLQTKYLQHWIDNNLATRYMKHPYIIQAFFTLPVHDTFTSAFHAIKSLVKEK